MSLALLMAVPIVGASWGGRGFYEPDTVYDQGIWMNPDPDTNPDTNVRQVYFSLFSGEYIVSTNANLAVLKTHVMNYPTNIHAFLGVWKDCNDDGYIGTIDSAALEYRSVALLDESICPPNRAADPQSPDYRAVHNDGEWVREFLWIGPDKRLPDSDENGCWWTPTTFDCTRRENATNPYNIADETARIWADWGLPADASGESCPVHPRPKGTYQSTGGFLRYADCHARWSITGAANDADAATDADEEHGIQIGFDDADYNRPDQSGSILNQENPYGQPSGESMVTAWDCSAEPRYVDDPANGAVVHDSDDATVGSHGVRVRDPTDGDNLYWNVTNDRDHVQPLWSHDANGGEGSDSFGQVNQPVVPRPNPNGGTPAGTVNHTFEGATGDCDRRYGQGENSDVYEIDEEEFEGNPAKRARTDMMFLFYEGKRAHKEGTQSDINNLTGKGTPPDNAGLGFNNPTLGTTAWFGTPAYAVSRNPYLNRETTQPWGGVYVTGYAYVGNPTVQVPAGSTLGIYGAEHCDGTAEKTGAWECDPLDWYPVVNPEQLNTPTGRNLAQAVVGDPYNLLDVDCYDAGTGYVPGVGTGVLVENGPCERPAPEYPWDDL